MNRVGRMLLQAMNDHESDNAGRSMDRSMRDDYARGYSDGYSYGRRDGMQDSARGGTQDGRDMFENDGARNNRRRRDRGESLALSKHDMMHWKHILRNADGSRGEHFTPEQVKREVDRLGIRFDEYSESEFCMAMNMLYSDFCEVNRSFVSPDREPHYYAKLAQAWLEDDDGPTGSEKLALYFYSIANDD